MKIKNQLPIGRLIGKIDNDFNIHDSDWIPRVAAWTIDALSQMKVLPMQRKRRRLEVSEKTAIFPCKLNATEIKVYDSNGCEVPSLEDANLACGCAKSNGRNSSTGVESENSSKYFPYSEIAVIDDTNTSGRNFMRVVKQSRASEGRNFVLNGNQFDLNFDDEYIDVESYEVATYVDDYYNEEVPYVYDNGLLLEALAWYCMFKYLSRGNKHPVYDLKSNSPVTNPFLQWSALKSKAAASVKNDIANDKGWANFFYNSTFRPRD